MTFFRLLTLFLFIHSFTQATEIHPQPMGENNSIKKQFVFAADDHAIVGVELTSGEVCGPIETTLQPKSLTTSPDGKVACLLADGLEQLTVIHFEPETPPHTLQLPCVPRGLALTNEGIGYLIQDDSMDILRLDLSTGESESFMTLATQPAQIHLHEKMLYISYQDSKELTQIDLTQKKMQTRAFFKNIPQAIFPINSERLAAVEKDAEKIFVYDLKKGHLIHTMLAKNTIPSHLQNDPILQVNAPGHAGFLTYRHSNQVIPFQLAADYPDRPTILPPQFQTIGLTTKSFVANSTTIIQSHTPNPSVLGETVTFIAVVMGVGSPPPPIPTGTVTFFDGVNNLGSTMLNTIGQVATATFQISSLTLGSHSISATYSGDANFITSTSLDVNQQVNNATNTSLNSTPNPSIFGETVILSASVTVVSPGSGTPSGTVTFMEGPTILGTGNLDGSGIATFSTSNLSVGVHTITAVYAGTTNFSGSSSPTINQVVNQANTTTSIISSLNPSTFGQTVTFNATVSANVPSTGIPTGFVNFMDGVTVIATSMVDGSGLASFSTSSLDVGGHSITAIYQGDLNYAGSSSAAISQIVNQASTNTIINSTPNPSLVGQEVVFNATVSSSSLNVPSGNVSFFDNSILLGVANLDSNGNARLFIDSLSEGVHFITAEYNGTLNYNSSTSTTLTQIVNFPQLQPPRGVRGVQKCVKFANEKEYVNIISWEAPLEGTSPLFYEIYRDALLTQLVAIIPSNQPLIYEDHNRRKNKIYTYYIQSVNDTGKSGAAILIVSP